MIINTRESILASAKRPDTAPAAPHYTLATFNAQQQAMYDRMAESRKAHLNNIACPQAGCGKELWDELPLGALTVNPATIDPANPPHQRVSCRACGWQGMRLL